MLHLPTFKKKKKKKKKKGKNGFEFRVFLSFRVLHPIKTFLLLKPQYYCSCSMAAALYLLKKLQT